MGGGGKGGGSSPKTPDYSALAVQQGQINKDTAQYLTEANRVNQYDPYGNSITWDKPQDGSASGWSQHQNLTPEQLAANQKMISDTNGAASQYGSILNKYLAQYNSNDGSNAQDAIYNAINARNQKSQAHDTDALTTQLRQQGLQPGSEAYNRAMQNLMTSQSDSNALTSQNATIASRNQGLQELSGIAGIASGRPYQPAYSNYSQATGYQPTDLLGAAGATNAANQSSANASNSKKSGLLGSATSLGGSYLGSK